MVKTTTKDQYKKLLEMLENKPDIAKGFTKRDKVEVISFWEEVATNLNSLGPPLKDGNGWKRKLVFSRKELTFTDGGANALKVITDLEEDVVRLTGMTTNVEGLRGSPYGTQSASTCNPAPHSISTSTAPSPDEGELFVSKDGGQTSSTFVEPPAKRKKNEILDVVDDLQHLHKSMLEQISAISKEMVTLSSGIKRTYRGIESLVEEKKHHNGVMGELLREKIKIKQQMLEIEISKL